MPDDILNITLAILADGEGSRMGRPKGSLAIHGRPILRHLLDRLAWPGPTLLVTAPGREHPAGWELFGDEAVDPIAGQGPLRGILTALEHARTDLLAVATVDMPNTSAGQIGQLVEHLRLHPQFIAAHYCRAGAAEPFPSVYRPTAAAAIQRMLCAGRRAVHKLANELPVAAVPAPADWPDSLWTNLNEPADLPAYLNNEQGAFA